MLNLLKIYLLIPILLPFGTNKFMLDNFSEIPFDGNYIYIYDDIYTCDPNIKYFILGENPQYNNIVISLSSNKSCYYQKKGDNHIKQNELDTNIPYTDEILYYIDKYSEDCIQIKYSTFHDFFIFDKSGEFSYYLFRSRKVYFGFENTINYHQIRIISNTYYL